jgi:putative ABC transport system substrate-binding protein
MRRRDFITLLGGATAWPFAARAQQGMPLIGYLHPVSRGPNAHLAAIIVQELAQAGYVEGRNLSIEYRFAEGRYDLLPQMAAELAGHSPALIVAANTPAAIAAKKATATVPILFSMADDPVELEIVASIAHPGGNATGVHYFNSLLVTKLFGLLRELFPQAVKFGLLVNPTNSNAKAVEAEVMNVTNATNMTIKVVFAADIREIEAGFTAMVNERIEALLVAPDPLFYGRRLQLTTLASRYALPTIYNNRDYVEAGGLMSYGTSLKEVYRQLGVYAARILKGEKPADLPVVQTTGFEFLINLPTARTLGLVVPPMLLARADEVIE